MGRRRHPAFEHSGNLRPEWQADRGHASAPRARSIGDVDSRPLVLVEGTTGEVGRSGSRGNASELVTPEGSRIASTADRQILRPSVLFGDTRTRGQGNGPNRCRRLRPAGRP